MKNSRYPQRGLSLVEIMVALVISSLLIAGIIQIFVSNKSSYRLQEGLGRMQENGRFAMQFLTQEIRQAGYLGCSRSLSTVTSRLDNTPPTFDPASGIQGWEYIAEGGTAPNASLDLNPTDAPTVSTNGSDQRWTGWTAPNGSALDKSIDVMEGSDILRVWHSNSGTAFVSDIQYTNTTSVTIETLDNAGISAGDFILLSDCETADLMQVCATSSGKLEIYNSGGNCALGNVLANKFSTLPHNATVNSVTTSLFFVGKRGGPADQTPSSLYFASLSTTNNDGSTGQVAELVEGVENMQVLYGEDTNADGVADQYLTADTVSNWQNIITVKLALLMSTISQVDTLTHGGNYDVNGTTINITPTDRRPRKVFTTTIQLRNRAI